MGTVKLVIMLALALLLAACAKHEKTELYVTTPDFITKDGIVHANRMEATPFQWTDGRYLLMVAAREFGLVEIYDGPTLVTSVATPIKLASAIVDNGRLYVFGVNGWNAGPDAVLMISTTDLVTWTAPVTVIPTQSPRVYFNNSVAKLPDGSFVMALETCEPGTECFNVRFFKSTDLTSWTETGKIFRPDEYAACPTIRYVDGYYYMFWLRDVGHWATYISRSKDLITWEDSSTVVLSSINSAGEGNNNSDLDLIEENGEVVINYADGDQQTWCNIRQAHYTGTLEQFVKEFFN